MVLVISVVNVEGEVVVEFGRGVSLSVVLAVLNGVVVIAYSVVLLISVASASVVMVSVVLLVLYDVAIIVVGFGSFVDVLQYSLPGLDPSVVAVMLPAVVVAVVFGVFVEVLQ